MQQIAPPQRLFTLDAIRGVAAIVVLVWHVPELHFLVGNGYLAVDFFFILSGLVVAKAYEKRLAAGMTGWQFMRIRFVRLYPMYMVGLFVGLVMIVAQTMMDREPLSKLSYLLVPGLLNALMLPGLGAPAMFPLNTPSWSLFAELLANIAFCIWLVGRSTRVLVAIALASGLAVLAIALNRNTLDTGWSWQTVSDGWFRVLYGFTLGMIIWRTIGQMRTRQSWFALVGIGALLLLMAVPIAPSFGGIYAAALALVVLPVTVMFGVIWQMPTSGENASGALGDLSYPLYAIHKPLVMLTWLPRQLGLPLIVWGPLFVAGLIVVAWILGRYIDPVLRRLLGNILPGGIARRSAHALREPTP